MPASKDTRSFTPNSYFDDLRLGDQYITGARTITETDLVLFSSFSGDYSALHTDVETASKGNFGQRIAHGALTLAISTGLEYRLMGDNQDLIVGFYGMDRVRFTAPVYIGDTVHLEGEVIGLDPKDPGRGIVTILQTMKKHDGTVVMSLNKRILNKRRATA